ncbi:cbb3-type cytochrome c oxidase subunit I, partial [Amaricoccus sp.]|nr:cytochrome-c oxidase, cbb3-type subunit I [Amaricoccus sp.]
MIDAAKIAALGILTLLFAIAANWGTDPVYRFHAFLLALLSAGLFIWSIRRAGGQDRYAIDGPRPESGYNDDVVRAGVIATTLWGVVGFLAGTYVAFQLAFPLLNWDLPWTSFGRLRPLHTSAVIFAFGG